MMPPFVKPGSQPLREELDAINFANKQHWNRGEHSHEADMEHQVRQERLEQIRKEMSELGTE